MQKKSGGGGQVRPGIGGLQGWGLVEGVGGWLGNNVGVGVIWGM